MFALYYYDKSLGVRTYLSTAIAVTIGIASGLLGAFLSLLIEWIIYLQFGHWELEFLQNIIDNMDEVIEANQVSIWNYTDINGRCSFELGKDDKYLFIIQKPDLRFSWPFSGRKWPNQCARGAQVAFGEVASTIICLVASATVYNYNKL